ncbi:uncharacterized protein [Henckelia pumila]|uniref:uncharacterized protein n=1 Tax=Henckelia pumila TaxID=405737 RepID=UPI003C6E6904
MDVIHEISMRQSDAESSNWLEAMLSEMDTMYSNQVWTLVDPPEGIVPIGCKLIYKRKLGADENVLTFKARLVAKVISLNTREEDDEISLIEKGTRKRSLNMVPIDQFAKPVTIDDASVSAIKKRRQQNINHAIAKKRLLEVHRNLARWVYEAGIPFHAINNNSFKIFVEALGQYGPGYTPPSQYQLREPLLKGEVERTKETLKKQEEEWRSNGFSIMIDAWSDRKIRSIINLCVNCKLGTTFVSSKEALNDAHTAQYIFEYVNACINEVGAQNVVQIVTDNASNNMAAVNLLALEKPNIFWTSCAAHTIKLMLEGISKLDMFNGVIKKAKAFTIFIYAHHKTLALMRNFTKREIVRLGTTRFATSFLTLQSLLDKKQELRNMMTSNEWDDTKWSRSKKGKEAFDVIVPNDFWNLVELCLRIFTPLVKVLRLVDGEEKPSMGFVYGKLLNAKNEIRKKLKRENDYKPILDIIDVKSRGRLDSPIHTIAYLLNPFYFFKNQCIKDDSLISMNMIICVEKFFPDSRMQHRVINIELQKYTQKKGAFGKKLATSGCQNNDENYNPIHTKKRNRLDVTRMNNLVYVQFNARLMNKKRRKDKLETLLTSDTSNAESWIIEDCVNEDEVDVETLKSTRDTDANVQRETNENEFASDNTEDEMNEEDDIELESDKELDNL